MTEQILHYVRLLQDAAKAGVGYTEKALVDGLSPATLQDCVLCRLADEVKAGRITQEESNEFQLNELPY